MTKKIKQYTIIIRIGDKMYHFIGIKGSGMSALAQIMKELGYPVLLGTSRKSVIGLTLDLPVEEREEGTMVTTVYGVQKGCAFVRVHDVEKNKRAIRMTRALMREHEV